MGWLKKYRSSSSREASSSSQYPAQRHYSSFPPQQTYSSFPPQQTYPSFPPQQTSYSSFPTYNSSYNSQYSPISKQYPPSASFRNQSALTVYNSESIICQIRQKYPSLSSLLTHNRDATIGFLKANGGLFAFPLSQKFYVPHAGTDNYKAWSDYRDAIEKYLEGICANVKAKDPHLYGIERSFKEELRQARKELSNEIHNKHYTRFPRWPAVYVEQKSFVDLNTGGIYDTGAYTIVWSCNGRITVTDKRPQMYTYIAEFSGKPDIKLLVIDHDKLRTLENTVAFEGIEKAKKLIGDSKYLRLTY